MCVSLERNTMDNDFKIFSHYESFQSLKIFLVFLKLQISHVTSLRLPRLHRYVFYSYDNLIIKKQQKQCILIKRTLGLWSHGVSLFPYNQKIRITRMF